MKNDVSSKVSGVYFFMDGMKSVYAGRKNGFYEYVADMDLKTRSDIVVYQFKEMPKIVDREILSEPSDTRVSLVAEARKNDFSELNGLLSEAIYQVAERIK